jgi:hippurate hydrolase
MTPMNATNLLSEARVLLPDAVSLRRALHREPEIGNHLPRTREKVLAYLEGLPLDVRLHETTSGIVAVLEGAQPGPAIILRGDMDALRMPENTDLEFASRVDDAMHACGHDLHTAMLVGAARLLSARRDELRGTVVFMFQPGEEGRHGARYMLDEGLLDVVAPRPTGAFALHVTAQIASGVVSHRPGPAMASADEIHVTITGRGGHASAPHFAADPIPVAAQIVLAVETAVTREINAMEPVVVTFGRIDAGTTHNVIPETARMEGTVRTLHEDVRTHVLAMLERIAGNIAAAHGLHADLEIITGYPVTVNDEAFSGFVTEVAANVLGPAAVVPMPAPIMGAEDWSYVLQKVPGVMAFLGACPPDLVPGEAPNNHSNRVRFDEDAIAVGIALHAAVAMEHLARGA